MSVLVYTRKFLWRIIYTFRVTENTLLLVTAVLIGILGGFGSIFVQFMIHFVESVPGKLFSEYNPYYLMLVPAVGGFIIGPIIYFFAREAKGHGVPEVMYAVEKKGAIIRFRVAFVKAVTAAICIGTGGSTGREGPIVQIGATIGSGIGQLLKLPSHKLKILVGCGVAAGIASTFHAPIAGTLFAVEIILRNFSILYLSPIIISAVIATVLAEQFSGSEFSSFSVLTDYSIDGFWQLIPYLVFGHFIAIVAVIFTKVLYLFEDFFDNLEFPKYLIPFTPAIGGFIIGGIALWFPQILGTGHESIVSALQFVQNASSGDLVFWSLKLMFFLAFVKIFATSMTLGSGGSGGIFAPSLFIGAMFGGAFGLFLQDFASDVFIGNSSQIPLVFMLVGMGSMVSATTHAPITAIFIIFELTRYEYHILLPLMLASIASTLFARRLMKQSIYTTKLLRKGLDIYAKKDFDVLQPIKVKQIIENGDVLISASSSLAEIIDKFISSSYNCFFVVDVNRHVIGSINLFSLKKFFNDYNLKKNLIKAYDVLDSSFFYLRENDNLNEAVNVFSRSSVEELPVVDVNGDFVGFISKSSLFRVYDKEITKINAADVIGARVASIERFRSLEVIAGYSMMQISVPKIFVSRSVFSLDIRAVFNVEIILIRKTSFGIDPVFPHRDYVFDEGDQIVIFGENRFVRRIENL